MGFLMVFLMGFLMGYYDIVINNGILMNFE